MYEATIKIASTPDNKVKVTVTPSVSYVIGDSTPVTAAESLVKKLLAAFEALKKAPK